MEKIMDYSSESIDVTKYVAAHLKVNNYKNRTEEENLNILESSLREYSISKLEKWGIGIKGDCFQSLESVLEVIDKILYNEGRVSEAYFKQYIHCILYILGEIRKQEQIELLEIELDDNVAILEDNNSTIKAIAINEKTKKYAIPAAIINAYRERYINKEKTLVK